MAYHRGGPPPPGGYHMPPPPHGQHHPYTAPPPHGMHAPPPFPPGRMGGGGAGGPAASGGAHANGSSGGGGGGYAGPMMPPPGGMPPHHGQGAPPGHHPHPHMLHGQQQAHQGFHPGMMMHAGPTVQGGGGGGGGAGPAGLSAVPKVPAADGANAGKSGAGKKAKANRVAAGGKWYDPTLEEWNPSDFRIFVGDLGNEVSDEGLARAFQHYPSIVKAKVVRDKRSGKGRGYGFVSFKDPTDYSRAMKEMHGKYIGNRPVKLRKSTWKDRDVQTVKKKEKLKAVVKPENAKLTKTRFKVQFS
eukprot:m.130988 g.130988  ORF g.130988 m.130988 type:complete len:301 (+) comp11301_c0_seq3:97-999(+)